MATDARSYSGAMLEIVVDNHRMSTELNDQDDGFRILLDGDPVAMTLTETETIVGNTRTHTRETRPPGPADWLPGGAALPGGDRLGGGAWLETAEIEVRPGRAVHLSFPMLSGDVYNTSVYLRESLLLIFDPTYTQVDVTWDHWADVST
ncbi:hypothetical protein [Parafrankia sp. EUN1f]|uniref:hypothetical protein n=1 Tax=Parafrankia sp. EUN1f TaxID=102897 RepID=UPI001E5656C4|nr:hypothetical protein [Parafrankia sp. EUN1f]